MRVVARPKRFKSAANLSIYEVSAGNRLSPQASATAAVETRVGLSGPGSPAFQPGRKFRVPSLSLISRRRAGILSGADRTPAPGLGSAVAPSPGADAVGSAYAGHSAAHRYGPALGVRSPGRALHSFAQRTSLPSDRARNSSSRVGRRREKTADSARTEVERRSMWRRPFLSRK